MVGPESRRSERDARAVTLWVTDVGRQRAERVLAARAERLRPVLATTTAEQREQLVAFLKAALARLTDGPDAARSICRFCDEDTCRPHGRPVEKAACAEC